MKGIKVGKEGVQTDSPMSDREARWESFLANYKQKNPVKFASKEANGEFKKIPDSFK